MDQFSLANYYKGSLRIWSGLGLVTAKWILQCPMTHLHAKAGNQLGKSKALIIVPFTVRFPDYQYIIKLMVNTS